MFSRGPVAMHAPMNSAAEGMVAPPGVRGGQGGGAPISVQRPPHPPQNYAYPPGPHYATSSSAMLQTYAAGTPAQAPGPTPSTSRLQHSMAPQQQGPPVGASPQYSVEQAISQSLPPGAGARPYPATSTSFPSQPLRPPPPTHSISYSHAPPRPPQPTRRYSSAGRYTEPGDQMMGSGMGPERGFVGGGAGDAFRESMMPPGKAGAARGDGGGLGEAPMGYEQAPRFEGKPVFGAPEPDHRHLFHSYILDYFQKQGYHAAAQAFLHDVPDTPVQQRPGKGKDRATPRDEDQHSEQDDASPRGALGAYTNGIGRMSKPHDTNSPHDFNNRPQSSGPGATDSSIDSTNSSSSHFGFPSNKTGTESPSTSPDLDHRSLPQALVQIESPQGFLFEWWTVFWDVFRAKAEKGGSASARAYVDVSTAAVDLALRTEMARMNGESFPSRQFARPLNPQNVPLPPSPPPQPARHYLAPDRPYPPPPQRQPSLHNPHAGPNIAQRPPHMAPPQIDQAQQAAAQAQAARGYSERVHVGPGGTGVGGGPGVPVGGAGPQGIPRQATLHRRGALSPMPPPGYVVAQAPQQPPSQMQYRPTPTRVDRERQQFAQQQQQEHARQAQFAQSQYQGPLQPQQHLPPQQLAPSQQQQRFDPSYQENVAQAQVAGVRAQNPAVPAQAQVQRAPVAGSAEGSPHATNGIPLREPGRASNASSPYAQQHLGPSTAHAMASLDFHASPSKRFKSIPGAPGESSDRLPPNGTSPGYSQQGSDGADNAYRPQLSANQNGALSYALGGTSPHPDAPSPYPPLQYAADPQARPPPPPRTASAQYQGGPPGQQEMSSPHPNAGPYGTPDYCAGSPAFNPAVPQGYPSQNGAHSRPPSVGPSQQSMLEQQYRQQQQLEGSMRPPPVGPPPLRRTLSQIGGGASNAPTPQAQTPASHHGSPTLPTPQTPGGAIPVAVGAAGKRKREAKDAREPKKRATAKGRDRSDSMASTVPAPTPFPAAGTPQYAQSPVPATTTSPPPSAALSSDLAGLGGLYPYSAASDLGMAPSLVVGDDLGIPSASADHMDIIFASADFGALSTDETFDYNSWINTNSFDAFPDT